MQRLLLVSLPGTMLATVAFYLLVAWPYWVANQPRPAPEQPIHFDHTAHTHPIELECAFCHRTAASADTAGLPDVEQCMFCHLAVGRGQPEIEKLRAAWVARQPVAWNRVHRLPDHTHFPHGAHARADVTCAECHGDVASMTTVTQVRPLTMGDCLDCHRQRGAPTECGVCHY